MEGFISELAKIAEKHGFSFGRVYPLTCDAVAFVDGRKRVVFTHFGKDGEYEKTKEEISSALEKYAVVHGEWQTRDVCGITVSEVSIKMQKTV